MNLQEAFDAGFESVKTYVERSFDAFEVRLIEVERRAAVPGQDGRNGADGIDGAAGRDGVDGTSGKDGRDGVDGKDAAPVTHEQIIEALLSNTEAIEAAVAQYISDNPPAAGKDGANGADGKDGRDGVDGKDGAAGTDGSDGAPGLNGLDGKSVSLEDVLPAVNDAVQRSVSAIEIPRGEKGDPGKDGAPGERGLPGANGKDGVGLAGSVIDRSGNLIVTLTDGSTRELGSVVGRDGRDGVDGKNGELGVEGKDGQDGLGFDDMDLVDTGSGLALRFARGDLVKDFALPVVVDRGVWREGDYAKGAGVTWGGSFWIAQRDTSDKPEASDAWRLAVKKGRDGKSAQ